ncbi:MAG: hypothetical protein ACRD5L_01820 [Bryobacteraceae bacterium]
MKAAVLLGLSMLAISLPSFGEDGTRQSVLVTSTERADFPPGGLIRLNTSSGNLIVEAWDQPQVEITTTKSTRRSYQPNRKGQATQCLESVRIATERPSSAELAVSTMAPRRGFFQRLFGKCSVEIEQQIRAPRNSRLVIHHDAGYVLVSRMTGEIEATSRSGDIVLMLPDPCPYSIDAETKIGSVSSDFAGATHRKDVLSEQFTSSNPAASRRIFLRMYLGGITIKELPPTADAPALAGGQ